MVEQYGDRLWRRGARGSPAPTPNEALFLFLLALESPKPLTSSTPSTSKEDLTIQANNCHDMRTKIGERKDAGKVQCMISHAKNLCLNSTRLLFSLVISSKQISFPAEQCRIQAITAENTESSPPGYKNNNSVICVGLVRDRNGL